jgi:isopenicillin-N N-acyltransferase-like protein
LEIIRAISTQTLPDERGAEIGRAVGSSIRESVRLYLDYFSDSGLPERWVREVSEGCFAALQNWAPNLAREIAAVAAAADVELWQLAALNARTEVLATLTADTEGECSTAVFAPAGKIPQTIQTWDWHAPLCPRGLVVSYVPDLPADAVRRVGRVSTFTECGVLAKIGVNDAGVGVHFNILHHVSDRGVNGVPVHAIARRVLDEATSLEEAESIIRSAPASASTVLTVISRDTASRAACFEISPERVERVPPRADGILLHTNHFLGEKQRIGEAARSVSTTYKRLSHLERVSEQMREPLPFSERAKRMCGSTGEDAPVCLRPDPALSARDQWRTLLTVGLNVDTGILEYYPGFPFEVSANSVQRSGA